MPTIRHFLPIDPSWYFPREHLLKVPEVPIVKTCSRMWGFLLWVFGQAVFLRLEGRGSHRIIYVSKRRAQEFLGASASKEHVGRQFAEKIYMLAQHCKRSSLPEEVNCIRREADKTKESLQQLPDRDIQSDIRELIERIQSNACRLLQGQVEEEMRQAIVDTALLELRAMAIEVSVLCARDSSSFRLPAHSEEAKEWYQRIFSAFQVGASVVALKPLLAEGSRRGFLNQKFHPFFGGSILHMLAKREGYGDLMPFVRDLHGDFSSQDFFGNTPLMWAIANACNGNARSILLASDKGAAYLNLSDTLTHQNTALHLAVGKGYTTHSRDRVLLACSNLELVNLLLEKGINPNIPNGEGDTPLHLACARRDTSMIQALLRGGADPSLKNKAGKTAQELISLSYSETKALLERTVAVFLLPQDQFDAHRDAASLLFA